MNASDHNAALGVLAAHRQPGLDQQASAQSETTASAILLFRAGGVGLRLRVNAAAEAQRAKQAGYGAGRQQQRQPSKMRNAGSSGARKGGNITGLRQL